MTREAIVAVMLGAILVAAAIEPVAAQPPDESMALVVRAGRPLRVTLDERVTATRVGQTISGTVVDHVYAYDRIVIPAGTRARGQVRAFEPASTAARLRAMLGGKFSPLGRPVLQFERLIFADGSELSIDAVVTGGVERVRRRVAGGPARTNDGTGKPGVAARTRAEIVRQSAEASQRAKDALAALKAPGKLERVRDAAIRQLPYYPPFLSKGTVFDVELVSTVSFGMVVPRALAPPGSLPAPSSLLSARLVTPLDSAKTPRGTPIEAVVTEPVFSAEQELILPEGTALTGEVTFAKQARRFRRNGQLRFLFDAVRVPDQDHDSRTLLASLYAVQSGDAALALDEEGGASIANSKRRFLTPALAVLALRASAGHDHHHDGALGQSGGTPTGVATASGPKGSRGLGGFFGFGLIGVGLSQASRPVALAFGVVGAARTTYSSVFGRGQEVVLPAAAPMQLQLAPGSTREPEER